MAKAVHKSPKKKPSNKSKERLPNTQPKVQNHKKTSKGEKDKIVKE
jgi:hypothetical protein